MKSKKTEASRDVLEVLNSVLSALRAVNSPLLIDEIAKATELDGSLIRQSINYLGDQGYDIKTVIQGNETRYVLVRFGQNEMGAFYRSQGALSTPLILTSDWHVGSYGFSEIALKRMIADVEQFGVRDILIAGDLYQGRGVHRVELEDCKSLSTDTQEEWGSEILDRFPSNTRFHAVIGNHEEKLKGSIHVGHDMLLATAKRCKNFAYYGHVAKFDLNKKFTILAIHTSGGLAYAKTYRAERVFDQLAERPNLLATGHMHQLFAVGRAPNIIVCQCGTLQRENAYLLNKGVTAQVGYLLLQDFTDEDAVIRYARPKVF
jgi:hypothetical protein